MYKGHKVIDVHSHMTTPPEYSLYSVHAIMVRIPTHGRRLEMSDDSLESALQGHMKAMDDRNIDFQLISPRPNHMWHWEVDYVQENWCHVTNDVIAQTCRLHPDRFAGIAQLPQNKNLDTRNCLEELERCVKDLGFVGAIVNTDPGADGDIPGVHEEYWFPLYEKAQELDIPLIIHPAHSRDRRIKPIPNNYQLMVAFGEFLTTSALEHSNVFEIFPKLKVVVSHFGGGLNRFLLNDENHTYGNKDLKDNLFFDTCAYEENFIRACLKQKGVHRCLFGTEAPGAGSWAWNNVTDRPQDDLLPVFERIEFLSDDDKIDIYNRNVLKVFSKLKID